MPLDQILVVDIASASLGALHNSAGEAGGAGLLPRPVEAWSNYCSDWQKHKFFASFVDPRIQGSSGDRDVIWIHIVSFTDFNIEPLILI